MIKDYNPKLNECAFIEVNLHTLSPILKGFSPFNNVSLLIDTFFITSCVTSSVY